MYVKALNTDYRTDGQTAIYIYFFLDARLGSPPPLIFPKPWPLVPVLRCLMNDALPNSKILDCIFIFILHLVFAPPS